MLGNNQLKKFMDTPMSRKQFLRYMGMLMLSLFGVGNVISTLLQGHNKAIQPPSSPVKKRGFGSGKYGV